MTCSVKAGLTERFIGGTLGSFKPTHKRRSSVQELLDVILYIVSPDNQFSIWLSRHTVGMSFWGLFALLSMHHGFWVLVKFGIARSIVVYVRKRKQQRSHDDAGAHIPREPRTRFAKRVRNFMATMKRQTKGKQVTLFGLGFLGLEPWCQKVGILIIALQWERYNWRGLIAVWIGGSLSLVLNAIALVWFGRESMWIMYGLMGALGIIILIRWLKKNGHQNQ